jgi:hypothetical protein
MLMFDYSTAAILNVWRHFENQANEVLAPYFPVIDNNHPGNEVWYDRLVFWRTLADGVARGGDPVTVAPPQLTNLHFMAPTFSDQIEATPQQLKDMRRPGELAVKYGDAFLFDALTQIKVILGNRLELLRAQALGTAGGVLSWSMGGVAMTADLNYPAACQLIHSGDWSDPTFGTSGNGIGIVGDLNVARAAAMARSGVVPTDALLNYTTMQYVINSEAIVTRFAPEIQTRILTEGRLTQLAGFSFLQDDYTYMPATLAQGPQGGAATYYVPDNFVALFPGGDNSHRGTVDCEAVSGHSGDGVYGFFPWTYQGLGINSPTYVQFEYTGCPVPFWPLENTFDADVTANLDSVRERLAEVRRTPFDKYVPKDVPVAAAGLPNVVATFPDGTSAVSEPTEQPLSPAAHKRIHRPD